MIYLCYYHCIPHHCERVKPWNQWWGKKTQTVFLIFLPTFLAQTFLFPRRKIERSKKFPLFFRSLTASLAPNLLKMPTIKVRHWTPVERWRDKTTLSLCNARNLLKCLLWQAAFNPAVSFSPRTAGGSKTQPRTRKWQIHTGIAASGMARERPFRALFTLGFEFDFVKIFHH